MNEQKPYTMTIAEFRALIWNLIKDLPETNEISFGGGALQFHRVKGRSDHLVDIEFNQVFTVTAEPDAG